MISLTALLHSTSSKIEMPLVPTNAKEEPISASNILTFNTNYWSSLVIYWEEFSNCTVSSSSEASCYWPFRNHPGWIPTLENLTMA